MAEKDPWEDQVFTDEVPVPTDTRTTDYPWDKFTKVGLSTVFYPDEGKDGDTTKQVKNRIDNSLRTFGKKKDPAWKFTSRVVLDENDKSCVRIWRIE